MSILNYYPLGVGHPDLRAHPAPPEESRYVESGMLLDDYAYMLTEIPNSAGMPVRLITILPKWWDHLANLEMRSIAAICWGRPEAVGVGLHKLLGITLTYPPGTLGVIESAKATVFELEMLVAVQRWRANRVVVVLEKL